MRGCDSDTTIKQNELIHKFQEQCFVEFENLIVIESHMVTKYIKDPKSVKILN